MRNVIIFLCLAVLACVAGCEYAEMTPTVSDCNPYLFWESGKCH